MKNILILITAVVGVSACASKTASEPEVDYSKPITLSAPAAQKQAEVAPSVTVSNQAVLKKSSRDYPSLAESVQQPLQMQVDNEKYAKVESNITQSVQENPISTFSIDVDTASYANARRFIMNGRLPPKDAVRPEEFINYFSYNYERPKTADTPFAVDTEVGPSPWNKDKYLLHVGIKGYEPKSDIKVPKNLVFLLDVSGSMQAPNKLGLVKKSLALLVKQLNKEDSIAIVVYAGSSGLVLPPTPANNRLKIMSALNSLRAGGSTNGGEGIRLAYQVAQQAFIKNGINRVILATDGDFNVGITGTDNLVELVSKEKQKGVGLTVLGFGMGNYNDNMMEMISNKGDGNAAYIDSLKEAQKVLVHDLKANLMTIAKDTKIQIEFNPAVVSEYRLIGYEDRMLNREDFNNDKVDAGEVGAGHSVTAIYELSLVGGKNQAYSPLRYQTADKEQQQKDDNSNELGFLKIRYKLPNETSSRLLTHAIEKNQIQHDIAKTSTSFQFSAAVSAFAQKLRGGKYLGEYSYRDIASLARQNRGDDKYGYRSEFLQLVELAASL